MRRMLPPSHLKKQYKERGELKHKDQELTEYDREAEINPPSPLPFANGMFGNSWHTQLPSMDEQERKCR